jgi:phage portal protein BeeE
VGLFRTKKESPAFGSSEVKAAAGSAGRPGLWQTYTVGAGTARALSIPTVSRAVGLITSTIAGLDLRTYTLQWDPEQERYERIYIEGESWMTRPDPKVTRNFMISGTVKDLMLHGRSFWYITTRYSTGFPASFVHLPIDNVNTPDEAGPEWFGPAQEISFNGVDLDPANVVQFLSPLDGILWTGARSIDIAYRLDEAAKRFASTEIAAGYLQQTDGSESLSGEELSELAQAWATARQTRAVGALNNSVRWEEFKSNPATLQLMEGRQHAALELSRICQVPAWLVGLSVGGMTYQNSQQARTDLILFGAMPFIRCIEETLSLDTIMPRGRHVEFDVDAYIAGAELTSDIPIEEPVAQEAL